MPCGDFLFRNRVQRYNKKMKNTNYFVKNRHSYGILLLALLLCGSASAKVENYIGMSLNAGEWTLLPSGSQYTGSLGAAGGVGFVYELRAGSTYSPTRFLFDVGVGAWGGMTSFMQSADQTKVLENQLDLQIHNPNSHQEFDYVYELKGRRDRYNNVAAQVPLMVGVQHKRFYMLVGAKLNASVWTKTQTVATLNTYGDYTRYGQGEFRNMPEYQFFENKRIKGGVQTSLNLDVDLSLEIGGRIGGIVTDAVGFDVPKDRVEYRLAAFVDYGLFDLHKQGSNGMLTVTATYDIDKNSPDYIYKTETMIAPNKLILNDIMSTTGFASAVKNLMVGLKFTILFQIPEPGQCVICRDAYVSTVGSGRVRSGGVKYEE